MNSSPNRVRLLVDGRHCSCCSQWLLRIYFDESGRPYATKHTPRRRAAGTRLRIQHRSRHGRSKPRGIHAYRRAALTRPRGLD